MWRYRVLPEGHTIEDELRRKRGVIMLSTEMLQNMLRLPDGIHIRNFFIDHFRDTIGVIVCGRSLHVVPEGNILPTLDVLYSYDDNYRIVFEGISCPGMDEVQITLPHEVTANAQN